VCGPGGIGTIVEQIQESVELQVIGNKVPACEWLEYGGKRFEMIMESFIYLEPYDFLVSYQNGSDIINIINNEAYYENEVIGVECGGYLKDTKYFIEYIGIEFVEWLNFLSFIL
jgi:hypothetical protein